MVLYWSLGIPVPAGAFELALFLPNSRKAETEADIIGMRLAARACYDPGAAMAVFTKLGQAEAAAGGPDVPVGRWGGAVAWPPTRCAAAGPSPTPPSLPSMASSVDFFEDPSPVQGPGPGDQAPAARCARIVRARRLPVPIFIGAPVYGRAVGAVSEDDGRAGGLSSEPAHWRCGRVAVRPRTLPRGTPLVAQPQPQP